MTTFTLKIIAILSMLIDHIGAYFQYSAIYSGAPLVDNELVNLMRAIGRIALPIFAYFIVVGFTKTSNIKNYIGRVHLYALISQIPFTLAFYQGNYFTQDPSHNIIAYNNQLLFLIIPMILAYIVYNERKFDRSIIYLSLAWLIVPFLIIYKGIYIFTAELNIFYELGAGLILMAYISKLKDKFKENIFSSIILILGGLLTAYLIIVNGNYGSSSLILILGLYLLREFKIGQFILIALWGIKMYSWSLLNVAFVIFAGVLLLLYNGEKGKSMKYLFYGFYPVHLLIIGLTNIFLR